MGAARNTSLRYPGGRRALWGAIAYVAGFALFVPVAAARMGALLADATTTLGGATIDVVEVLPPASVPDLTGAAILYANAQFVPLSIPLSTRGRTAAATLNLLTQEGGAYLLLLLVPATLFAVSGALATRGLRTTDPWARAKAATLQFTGALPLAFVTVLGFTVSVPAGSGGPSLLWGIVVCGWLYPTLFGAVGAYVAEAR